MTVDGMFYALGAFAALISAYEAFKGNHAKASYLILCGLILMGKFE